MKAPLISIFRVNALIVKNDELIVPVVIKVVKAVEMEPSKSIVEKGLTKEETKKAEREAEKINHYLEETGCIEMALRDEEGSEPTDFPESFAGVFVCLEHERFDKGFVKSASPADKESAAFRARPVCVDMGGIGATFILQAPERGCEFTVLSKNGNTIIPTDADIYKVLKTQNNWG